MSRLRITQRRSRNGSAHSVEHDDTPQIRGMIAKVAHLVEVSENPNG